MQNLVWRDVVKLTAIVMKDPLDETVKRERETATKKGVMDDFVSAHRF